MTLRHNKKYDQKRKKNSANETLKIIEQILDCNKNAQSLFSAASYADKGKSEPRLKRVLQREQN